MRQRCPANIIITRMVIGAVLTGLCYMLWKLREAAVPEGLMVYSVMIGYLALVFVLSFVRWPWIPSLLTSFFIVVPLLSLAPLPLIVCASAAVAHLVLSDSAVRAFYAGAQRDSGEGQASDGTEEDD